MLKKDELKELIKNVKDPALGLILCDIIDNKITVTKGDTVEPITIASALLRNGDLVLLLSNNVELFVGNVIGPPGPPGPPLEYKWDGTKLCIKNPETQEYECVDLRGAPGRDGSAAITNLGGGSGQPIVIRLTTLFNGSQVSNDTRTIDFTGDVNVTKTGKNSILVDVNRLDLMWITVDSDTQLQCNAGYVIDSASKLNLTLPQNCRVGDKIKLMALGEGGFEVLQNASQKIIFGNKSTSLGASGSLETVNLNNTVSLICVKDNDIFMVESSIGNFKLK